tara:strand:+ start:609 stop:1127 length:519 start_codon:yes stop_codon:yes gene_type:complete
MQNIKKYISDINDFPRNGIVFKDINPLYKNPKAWHISMAPLEELINRIQPDIIAGIESRGFIIASALAYKLHKAFIPIRKPNKLPGELIGYNYKLEYGLDRLEIQADSIDYNSKVIIIDDLLATGGTAEAAKKLINKAGGNTTGFGFLVELTKLNGRLKIDEDVSIESVIKY